MIKLLIDNSIPAIDTNFAPHFQITRYCNSLDIPQLLEDNEVIVCRTNTQINDDLLANSNIKLIGAASSGTEHIKTSSIPIVDAKGCNSAAVCDYIFAILANLKISNTKTIGIIGFGNVGSLLAQRLMMFDFKIQVFDPFVFKPKALAVENFLEITKTDVIIICPNYHTDTLFPTHHLINNDFFERLSANKLIINTSRGNIVDEAALISNWSGFFCTDVFQNEPYVNSELVAKARICTPHIAGHSIEAKLRITATLSKKIHSFFKLDFNPDNLHHTIPIRKASWQEDILNYYNPEFESQQLKKNHSPTNFKALRQRHIRHEFEFID